MSESRRTRRWFGFAAAAAGLALAAAGVAAQGPSLPNGAIAIAKQGSFEAGGKVLYGAAQPRPRRRVGRGH